MKHAGDSGVHLSIGAEMAEAYGDQKAASNQQETL